MPDLSFYQIEWLPSDPLQRTVTPNGKQTVKERVQQLIDIATVASRGDALDYWPGQPLNRSPNSPPRRSATANRNSAKPTPPAPASGPTWR